MVDRDPGVLDATVEQLLTALFVQVCQFSYDSSTEKIVHHQEGAGGQLDKKPALVDFKRRNHYEVLR